MLDIRFIIYALSSCDETRVHLDILHQTGSLNRQDYDHFTTEYDKLGRKLNNFLQAVIARHKEPYRQSPTAREPDVEYNYLPDADIDDALLIEDYHLDGHLHGDPSESANE